ncbi:MAG: NADH-ubiquinone oxidoreductase-F iron-sulfur binding region domain-containing protein [bacterium]
MAKFNNIEKLNTYRDKLQKSGRKKVQTISICGGTGCIALGSIKIIPAFDKAIKNHKLSDEVEIVVTGCHGFCEKGPLVVIRPDGIFYQNVQPEDAEKIVAQTIMNGEIIEELIFIDSKDNVKYKAEEEVPFYSKQMRLIFGQNGYLNPTSIDDYIAIGGYSALARVLTEMSPQKVIKTITNAGLRGRGGGGFSTGKKWAICRRAKGDGKYVICNADEGDPGAYMDRSLLEGNPHSVLEGMIIGAYAIGSGEGYIYVREEYPLARKHFAKALDDVREYGLVGENILDSDFSFDVKISVGGGAFVSGEETALMASIEGKVGQPRPRPPYPAEKGVWGKPTNINNVETWANIPLIINKGAEWYSNIGTEGSKGTKIFSLVGKVNNTGIVEVPMGMTLREIIYEIGGGIKNDKKFKAVQTGGPSGGLIPEQFLDTPVDFDQLTRLGSMMGSGGMIVLDEDNCVVDIAKYFIDFLKGESCGKCTPCKEGLLQKSEILARITAGEGTEEDIEALHDLGWLMKNTSLCELGKTAPNPLLTAMKYFPEEFQAHVKNKKCPAGVCKALITFRIDEEKCTGCALCVKKCPTDAIMGEAKQPHTIDPEKCTRCKICYSVCKFDAVIRE